MEKKKIQLSTCQSNLLMLKSFHLKTQENIVCGLFNMFF